MKWYKASYINRRDWILENLELLNLTAQEAMIVLLIDFCNENNKTITTSLLAKKTQLSEGEVDKVLSVLTAKNYLLISALSTKVSFNLDKLFEIEVAHDQNAMNSDLFNLFETQFGKPLTSNDMMKISDLTKKFDNKLIVYALRQAVINEKVSLPYVEKILNEWQDSNITVKRIEEGTSFESK